MSVYPWTTDNEAEEVKECTWMRDQSQTRLDKFSFDELIHIIVWEDFHFFFPTKPFHRLTKHDKLPNVSVFHVFSELGFKISEIKVARVQIRKCQIKDERAGSRISPSICGTLTWFYTWYEHVVCLHTSSASVHPLHLPPELISTHVISILRALLPDRNVHIS